MECQDSSGAKHRCGPATDLNGGSCPRSCRYCHWNRYGLNGGNGLLSCRLYCFWSRHFSDAKCGSDLSCLRRLQELLEVTIFGENIGQSLLNYIVGASTNESRILINLCGGCIGEANRGADLFGLDYFE